MAWPRPGCSISQEAQGGILWPFGEGSTAQQFARNSEFLAWACSHRSSQICIGLISAYSQVCSEIRVFCQLFPEVLFSGEGCLFQTDIDPIHTNSHSHCRNHASNPIISSSFLRPVRQHAMLDSLASSLAPSMAVLLEKARASKSSPREGRWITSSYRKAFLIAPSLTIIALVAVILLCYLTLHAVYR